MKETKTYEFHELSNYLPLLEGEEFNDLVKDIKEFGQIEPATIYEGKILDGRNRYRACKELKIELLTKEWNPSKSTGRTPLQYVISENIMRRNLNEAQKGEIGLILYPDIAKETDKLRRKKQTKSMIKTLSTTNTLKNPDDRTTRTAYKVAQKVHTTAQTIDRVKKITEIAKINEEISNEWQQVKKGDGTIDPLYHKAIIIGRIKELSKTQQDRILNKLKAGESTPQQLKAEIQDLKDNISREEINKKHKLESQKKDKMEKIHLNINHLTKEIYQLENTLSLSKERLIKLSREALKEYPQIDSEDPAVVITALSTKYDTLNTTFYDTQLRNLKIKYNNLKEPILTQIKKLDVEYNNKKADIDKKKYATNQEAFKIEKLQNQLNTEYEKQDLTLENISNLKSKMEKLQKEYENV